MREFDVLYVTGQLGKLFEKAKEISEAFKSHSYMQETVGVIHLEDWMKS